MSKFFKVLLLISIFIQSSHAAVTFEEFTKLKKALYLAYEDMKPSANDLLSINTKIPGLEENYWWNINMVHASYVRLEAQDSSLVTHNIYLMGGFARLEGMTLDGLATTACHEIGHGIGGAPKKDPTRMNPVPSAMEGQSDYFATKVCLPIVFKYLEQTTKSNDSDYIERLCATQSLYEMPLCKRLFTALEADIFYFQYLGDETSFEEFSNNIAVDLDKEPTAYPDSQCRIDTMIHGILKLERPQCWFPGGAINGSVRAEL